MARIEALRGLGGVLIGLGCLGRGKAVKKAWRGNGAQWRGIGDLDLVRRGEREPHTPKVF